MWGEGRWPRQYSAWRRDFSPSNGSHRQAQELIRGNLQLCSWNINGLTEEKIAQESAGSFLQEQDIIALQETWQRADRCIELIGYKSFHFIRDHLNVNAKRGSGGISVFIKLNLVNSMAFIKNHNDNIVWFEIKKNTFDNEKPIALGIVYLPPESSVHNQNKDDYFVTLEQDLLNLQPSFDILLMGDFNARVGGLDDREMRVIGSDAHLNSSQVLHTNVRFPLFMDGDRMSEDNGSINNFGKKLIELCRMTNIRMFKW